MNWVIRVLYKRVSIQKKYPVIYVNGVQKVESGDSKLSKPDFICWTKQ